MCAIVSLAGTNYIETLRVQVHANCRIRRIYFSGTHTHTHTHMYTQTHMYTHTHTHTHTHMYTHTHTNALCVALFAACAAHVRHS